MVTFSLHIDKSLGLIPTLASDPHAYGVTFTLYIGHPFARNIVGDITAIQGSRETGSGASDTSHGSQSSHDSASS